MADKAATLQQEQIKQLEEKMKQIDSMAKDQVYADPVKKVQTEMLYQLVAMRKSMAQGIEMACQVAATGGSGAGGKTVSKEDYDKLVADNKKLAYRITHLTRALDKQDGGFAVKKAGGSHKLYTTSDNFSMVVQQCQIVAELTGSSLDIVIVDEATLNSKEHQKLNPLGKYPLLETKEGCIAGALPICKYMCKVLKSMLGNGVLEQTKID